MKTQVVAESQDRIAYNVYASDGHLAYTLRAEPDSQARCPLQLTEHEADGGVVDTIALSPHAAFEISRQLRYPAPGRHSARNARPGDLVIAFVGDLVTIEDADGSHAVDLWAEPEEMNALSYLLGRAGWAFTRQASRATKAAVAA